MKIDIKRAKEAFKEYVNNKIGKELDKISSDEDIELPPEMPAVM